MTKKAIDKITNEQLQKRVENAKARVELLKELAIEEDAIKELWEAKTWRLLKHWAEGFGYEINDNNLIPYRFFNFVRASLVKLSFETILNAMSIAIDRFAFKPSQDSHGYELDDKEKETIAKKYLCGIIRNITMQNQDGIKWSEDKEN